jgi:hypothetical protein
MARSVLMLDEHGEIYDHVLTEEEEIKLANLAARHRAAMRRRRRGSSASK